MDWAGDPFWNNPQISFPVGETGASSIGPPILRKRGSNSGEKHFPADAFCARRPVPGPQANTNDINEFP